MPYINPDRRRQLDRPIDHLNEITLTPGDLAYVVTRLGMQMAAAPAFEQPHFTDYAAVIGVLEAVKMEFYRQEVAPYEDTKQRENGPVVA